MDKYCNNCGNYGHVYKSCRHPILSYGILLYTEGDDGGKKQIIMVEQLLKLQMLKVLNHQKQLPRFLYTTLILHLEKLLMDQFYQI